MPASRDAAALIGCIATMFPQAAPRADIRCVRRSQRVWARIGHAVGGAPCLVANTALGGFRCAHAELEAEDGRVTLDAALAAVLQVKDGDPVVVCPL